MGNLPWLRSAAALLGLLAPAVHAAEELAAPPPVELVVSVADQRLALVREGGLVKKYPISTSKFGLGDAYNSYKTPLGHLRVCDKIGEDLSPGSVIKHRSATGEVLQVNAPGRDPIVTRILWLEGLESGNANARARGIYIHGTVEESKLGQPVSYGCIRMRSNDVLEVFGVVPVGAPVRIIAEKLPHFQRVVVPKPEILVASNGGMTSTVSQHGMIVVRTGRSLFPEPLAPASAKLAAATAPASEPKAPAKLAMLTEKSPKVPAAAPSKVLAAAQPAPALPTAAFPPPPVAAGPTLVFTTGHPLARLSSATLAAHAAADASQAAVSRGLRGSILMAGLPGAPKPAPATSAVSADAAAASPTPKVEFHTRQASAVVVQSVARDPAGIPWELDTPTIILTSLSSPPPAGPLDLLSAYLFESNEVELRLAFRTALPARLEVGL